MSRKSPPAEKTTSSSDGRKIAVRLLPYAIPHALAGVELLGGVAAHTAWGGDPVGTPLTALAMTGGTAVLAGLAHRIGRVREQIVRWHLTTTVALAGAGLTMTTIIGPNPLWMQIMGAAGVVTGFSWNLRRLDSLRSDTGTPQAEIDAWANKLGLGGVKPGKVKELPGRREIALRHGVGDTVKTVQAALPAIEAAAGVLPGRSRVVPDLDNAARSTLVLTTEDALRHPIPWSGPSSPGGCITDPLQLSVYEDHLLFNLRLCGPGVIASHILWMGMSGAGKTMTALIAVGEILTRRNAIVWWFDASKGEQSVGPIRHAFDHYANTVADGHQTMKALKEIVKDRANALGAEGFDAWEPACYDHPGLRMPLLFAHFEEASELVRDSKTFVWLTEKARSTGVIISVSLQRATAESMPTDARYNIGTALCFGVGDDYSAGFALSDATIEAGAHPENWGNRKSGYFYAEAPSLDETRFAVPQRSYLVDKQLLVEVIDACAGQRATRDAVTSAAAARVFGKAAVLAPTTGVHLADMDDDGGGEDMDDIPAQPDADLVSDVDPSTPIPAHTGDDLAFGAPKPKASSPAAAAAEFDRVLAALSREGHTEVRVRQIVERLAIRGDTWVSRRLSAVADGRETVPPGLALERTDVAGTYRVHVLAGASA